jgi:hypothetical protein
VIRHIVDSVSDRSCRDHVCPTRSQVTWPFVVAWVVLALPTASAVADPAVEAFDLVSSTRVGRTTFDYSYRVRVRADSAAYASGYFTVTSTSTASRVIDPTVTLDAFDQNVVFLSTDTFTVRQDRTFAFDPSVLRFTFFGTPAGTGSSPDAPTIGRIAFFENGGRPAHEGSFPMQSNFPPGGTALGLTVAILGAVESASYRMLSTSDQVLLEGVLARGNPDLAGDSTYLASVTTPQVPFRIEITAVGAADQQPVLFRSATVYRPQPLIAQIIPSSGIVARGQTIDVTLRFSSGSAAGDYRVALVLPEEISGSAGPWVVNLQPGQVTQFTTPVTVSSLSSVFGRYTIEAEYSEAATPADIVRASVAVFVE